jgi:hypothetical protein
MYLFPLTPSQLPLCQNPFLLSLQDKELVTAILSDPLLSLLYRHLLAQKTCSHHLALFLTKYSSSTITKGNVKGRIQSHFDTLFFF